MHCEKIENFCVCDEKDACWKLENAYAEIVINAYCDTECHMYARLNNIDPFTQELVGDNGKRLKLSDQLGMVSRKIHYFKEMNSSSEYYVKAKSISCKDAGSKCSPIKCQGNATTNEGTTPATPIIPTTETTTETTPTTLTTPTPTIPTTKTTPTTPT
uniref:Uncharacterized protein n=1 Tax=Meloidogyne incognita TaxID=6306 RepID=A0A914MUP6_MELIC